MFITNRHYNSVNKHKLEYLDINYGTILSFIILLLLLYKSYKSKWEKRPLEVCIIMILPLVTVG